MKVILSIIFKLRRSIVILFMVFYIVFFDYFIELVRCIKDDKNLFEKIYLGVCFVWIVKDVYVMEK